MDLFRALDSNSDGQVTQPELTKALKDLGVSASKDEIGKLFHQLDPDGSGGIEFRELQRAMLDEAKKEMDLGKNRPGLATLPQEPAAAPESTTSSSELPARNAAIKAIDYKAMGRQAVLDGFRHVLQDEPAFVLEEIIGRLAVAV